MAELNWPPAVVGALTLPQILCIGSDHPPGDGGKVVIRSYAEWESYLDRRRADDAEWGTP